MCGRYHIDTDTVQKVEHFIKEQGRQNGRIVRDFQIKGTERDVYPTDPAPVLFLCDGQIVCDSLKWGLLPYSGKQVIFNARSESAMEKPLFRDSIAKRRVAIPAAWFYEWDKAKGKHTFSRKDQRILFLAGCYKRYEDGDRFVILTTDANASMRPVHNRMPLILEENEVFDWIFDEKIAAEILKKTPCLLQDNADYEQMSLF